MTIAIPTETFLPQDETPLLSSRRQAGWSAANQRMFLEGIAEGHGVDIACARVGLSPSSAYAFRRTAKGAAFALGWRAGTLLARETIAETLLVRALEGQVDTLVRADGSTVTRHRHDNRLAMSLLARLDRQVEHAPDADISAARLVAQEFDAFLGLVERDEGPARAGLFLARRAGALGGDIEPSGAGAAAVAPGAADGARELTPMLGPILALAAADRFVRTGIAAVEDIPVADLDPAARHDWTAEQWARADAAGLLAFAAPPEPAPEKAPASQQSQHSPQIAYRPDPDRYAEDHVWWDEEAEDWRTDFPAPDDFDGVEEVDMDDRDYARELTPEEHAVMGPTPEDEKAEDLAALAGVRDRYFARLAAEQDAELAQSEALHAGP